VPSKLQPPPGSCASSRGKELASLILLSYLEILSVPSLHTQCNQSSYLIVSISPQSTKHSHPSPNTQPRNSPQSHRLWQFSGFCQHPANAQRQPTRPTTTDPPVPHTNPTMSAENKQVTGKREVPLRTSKWYPSSQEDPEAKKVGHFPTGAKQAKGAILGGISTPWTELEIWHAAAMGGIFVEVLGNCGIRIFSSSRKLAAAEQGGGNTRNIQQPRFAACHFSVLGARFLGLPCWIARARDLVLTELL
jgi:hypothetical protein